MYLAHSMACTDCGRDMGAAISPRAHHQTLFTLEFTCVECVERIARSESVTLDSETSWGKVIAKIKGR